VWWMSSPLPLLLSLAALGFEEKKGGVRAVVKAPGRRLFKRRKSPSVIIRKGGIGEQS
jgi:hypothetical protein